MSQLLVVKCSLNTDSKGKKRNEEEKEEFLWNMMMMIMITDDLQHMLPKF
jgi:hypothetical protein